MHSGCKVFKGRKNAATILARELSQDAAAQSPKEKVSHPMVGSKYLAVDDTFNSMTFKGHYHFLGQPN